MVAFSVIHEMRKSLYHMMMVRKLMMSPLLDHPASFILVEYVPGLMKSSMGEMLTSASHSK